MDISTEKRSRLLDRILKELRLTTMLDQYDAISKLAIKESFGYDQFLLELVEQEVDSRRYRRVQSLLKQSKLPLEKTIRSFDLKRLPTKTLQQVRMVLLGDFITNRENVLAFGNPGSGKSHLLAGIVQDLICRKKIKVCFSTCDVLIQHLLVAKKQLELPKFLKKISTYDVLYIDDIGYVQQSREEMEVLFSLLASCYEQTSVLITSNLEFSKWEQIFKDPMTTAAVIDRLVHHSIILELNLPSYRLQKAKENQNIVSSGKNESPV